jgi:hypothetical protein
MKRLILIFCLIIMAGCAKAQSTPVLTPLSDLSVTPSATDSAASTTTTPASNPSTPTLLPLPTLTQFTPDATFTPAGPLSAEGPWVLFTAHYLWIMNGDGSGLQHVIDMPVESFAVRPGATAEHAEIAIVTGDPEADTTPKVLQLLTLPDRTIIPITQITASEIYYPLSETPNPLPVGEADHATFAIFNSGYLAWSPVGTLLAFTSSLPGPTSDVYTYDPSNGEITQISSGPLHAYGLRWSSDGRWLIHEAEDAIPEMGRGSLPNGIWASSAAGEIITPLFDPKPEGQNCCIYEVFGWPTDNTVFAGEFNLQEWGQIRAVNVETGEMSIVRVDKNLSSAAYDPTRNEWLFYYDDPEDVGAGRLEFMNAAGEQEVILDTKEFYDAHWAQESGMFVIRLSLEEAMGWNADKGWVDLHAPNLPLLGMDISPDGAWLAWSNGGSQSGEQGVWVSAVGESPRQISNAVIRKVSWSPDSTSAFLISERGALIEGGGLWIADAPDFEPRLIAESLYYPSDPVWIP